MNDIRGADRAIGLMGAHRDLVLPRDHGHPVPGLDDEIRDTARGGWLGSCELAVHPELRAIDRLSRAPGR